MKTDANDFFNIYLVFICFHFVQITAKNILMQTVAVDWLKSDKQENDLAGRPGSIVQVGSKRVGSCGPRYRLIVHVAHMIKKQLLDAIR